MPEFEHDLERMLAALCLGESAEVNLPDIATRYAAACHDVNQRLRRCAELLKKGLRDEALQHAQTAPAVLDRFAELDFAERDAWAQFAKSRNLTMPPPLQTQLAVELNTAFAEAETMKDSVRRHRLLALARAPLARRLVVLWRLAKLDPLNPIWVKDLQIFEPARHRELEQEIQQAHQAGQLPRLQELVKELTSSSWTQPPPAALVQRARTFRDQHLARAAQTRLAPLEQQLTAATAAGNKAEAGALAEEALLLRGACGLPASHPVIQRIDLALAWVDKQNQREARLREWQAECGKLRQGADHAVSVEALQRHEQKVLAFGMGIPPDLETHVHDAIRQLERRRKMVQLGWFGVAFLVVFIFVLSMILWIRLRGRSGDEAPALVNKDQSNKGPTVSANAQAPLAVQTILLEKCHRCHGEKKKGGLEDIFDRAKLIETDADNPNGTKHLVPGKPDESALWLRIRDDSMPPTNAMPRLTEDEKTKIHEWIAQGAPSLR